MTLPDEIPESWDEGTFVCTSSNSDKCGYKHSWMFKDCFQKEKEKKVLNETLTKKKFKSPCKVT